MTVLTTPHERALTLLFSELERSASEQFEVLLGTPGTLAERTNETGTRFWVHRYSDALNRRQEMYLGKMDGPEIERRISSMREMIATANATIARVRLSSSKQEKDLRQAAVLIDALVERYPGAIEDAVSAVPKSAARHLARAIKALKQHLPQTAASAWDILHAVALAG